MKKILSFAAVSLVLSTSQAMAENTGCGLGTEILGEQDSILMQSLAVTTNGSSGNQTFGITSGTLGCEKPSKFVSNEMNEFVGGNMDMLAQDMSQGKGEALESLAELMQMEGAEKSAMFVALQQNFDKIFTDANVSSAQVIDNMYAVLG